MKTAPFRATCNAALLAAGLCAASLADAQTYQFIDLGVGSANGVNDLGEVVGQSNLGATLWNGSSEIGLVGGLGGAANAINDSGQIVGKTVTSGVSAAALWSNNGALTTLNGSINSYATGINNAGQIVGVGGTGSGGNLSLIWDHSVTPTVLGVSGGTSYGAGGINNSGTVVGSAYMPQGTAIVPVVWQGANATVLPSLINYEGIASAAAINDSGVIVGSSTNAPQTGASLPVEWKNGVAIELGTLGSAPSYAQAINNAGQIVGEATTPNGYQNAAIWQGTTAVNLNSYLTPAEVAQGWDLLSATGINNKGWIVGDAYNNNTGNYDAFLLEVSPVSEADTWAMLATGLVMMGSIAWFKPALLRGTGKRAIHGAGMA